MKFDWDGMFGRYVYNPEKTPYFIAVDRLHRRQARYEIFAYVLFMAVVFGVSGVIALSGKFPHGEVVIVPIYAFFTVWAAIMFGWTKNQMAASFCALAPIALALYFVIFGFPPKLGYLDKTLIGVFIAAWLYYSWRILRIASRYPSMPEPIEPEKPARKNPFDTI